MSLQPSATLDYYFDPASGVGEKRQPTATVGNLPNDVTLSTASVTITTLYGGVLGTISLTPSGASATYDFDTVVYGLGGFLLRFDMTLSNALIVQDLIRVNVHPVVDLVLS